MWRSRIKSERGAALLATLVLSLLFLGIMLWYLSQANLTARLQTREHSAEFALQYAESGLALAEQRLQQPGVLASPGTISGSLAMTNGRCAYTLVRSTTPAEQSAEPNPLRPVLIDAVAAGYYYVNTGSSVDPENGRKAQVALLRAKLTFRSLGTLLAATPGRLRVTQRTTALFGPLYGRDLLFMKDPEAEAPRGVIESAAYGDWAGLEDGSANAAPPFLVFNSTAGARPLAALPHFPILGNRMRSLYRALAISPASRLRDGAHLDGRVDPPAENSAPVYFCTGDLHIGDSLPFDPAQPLLIYVQGDLIIHDSMLGRGNSWAAFLVEKDIILDHSSPAQHLQLRGNFVANGAVRWKGSPPAPETFLLHWTGSLVSGQGYDRTVSQLPKKLIRWQVDDALLPLPRVTQILETQISTGKFRR